MFQVLVAAVLILNEWLRSCVVHCFTIVFAVSPKPAKPYPYNQLMVLGSASERCSFLSCLEACLLGLNLYHICADNWRISYDSIFHSEAQFPVPTLHFQGV